MLGKKIESRDRATASDEKVRLILLLVLTLISLICLSRWGVTRRNPLGELLSGITVPVQEKVNGLKSGIVDRVFSWRELWDAHQRAQALENENRQLRKQLVLSDIVESENERLRRLLSLSRDYSYKTIPADVIGTGTRQFRTVVLNRGSRDRVAVDMPVVSYRGLVGRVLSVMPHGCLVLLITDPNSAIGAFAAPLPDEGSPYAVPGLLQGYRSGELVFEPTEGEEVPQGTPVYTSALSTIYPAGIRVGEIEGPLSTGYYIQSRFVIRSEVDFDNLKEVLILSGLNRWEASRLKTESLDTEELMPAEPGRTPSE